MATPELTLYAPDLLSIVLGAVICDGFADGDMVTIEQSAPAFTKVTGSDRKTMRIRGTDRTIRVTLRCMQGSQTNDVLSAALTADLIPSSNGAGVVPLSIIDRSGRTVISSPYAWVAEWPQVGFGSEHSPREWVIETAEARMFVGGN